MKEKFLENKHLLNRLKIGLILIILLLGSIQVVSAAASSSDTFIIATINPYVVYLPPLTADITATPITINRDSISTILVAVTDSSDNPVGQATVTLTSSGGNLHSTSGVTDRVGEFRTTFSSSLSGTFTINVTASSSGYRNGADSVQVTVVNTPPTAYFTASPMSGQAPLEVDFDALGSSDIDGSIASYSWDFGDSKTGDVEKLTHTYKTPGKYYPTLTVTDNLGLSNTYSSEISVSAFPTLSVSLASSPISMGVDQSSTITITVTGTDGVPISDAFIILDSTSEGLSEVGGNTDSDGKFTTTFAGSTDGDVTINAIVQKDDYGDGSGIVKLTITPQTGTATATAIVTPVPPGDDKSEIPFGLIIAALLILILAIIGIFLWTREKMQLTPKQTSIPCDGESTLPIDVKFVNTFGKEKTQKKERDVEMKTTSGSIQNMVIPAGKESAEAILTSSTECGPVTVTGKAGNQVATVDVDFVSENVGIEIDISPASIPADGTSTSTATIKVKDEKGSYVSFSEERNVELTTTLGTITSPVTIPPKSLAATAIITSGQVSGTAVITASSDQFKGEGKIEFAELQKRYCMHCGSPMALEAASCPKCEKTPPSGVDTKLCASCNAVLPQTAKFCDKCGAKQPDAQQE